MSKRISGVSGVFVFSAWLGLAVVGCGGSAPSGVDVTLPDGTTVNATLGSGVVTLADTEWEFFSGVGGGQWTPFVTVRFGSEGQLDSFVDNTIASSIFGETIIFDGARHNTSLSGVQYAAATYGAETSDSSGFTFEGRLSGFTAGVEAAKATATASAVFDETDPDTVRGNFSFSSEVLLFPELFPQGNLDDEFSFIGLRVRD